MPTDEQPAERMTERIEDILNEHKSISKAERTGKTMIRVATSDGSAFDVLVRQTPKGRRIE